MRMRSGGDPDLSTGLNNATSTRISQLELHLSHHGVWAGKRTQLLTKGRHLSLNGRGCELQVSTRTPRLNFNIPSQVPSQHDRLQKWPLAPGGSHGSKRHDRRVFSIKDDSRKSNRRVEGSGVFTQP